MPWWLILFHPLGEHAKKNWHEVCWELDIPKEWGDRANDAFEADIFSNPIRGYDWLGMTREPRKSDTNKFLFSHLPLKPNTYDVDRMGDDAISANCDKS